MSLIDKINKHLEEDYLIMIEQKHGKVFLLKDHWRYLHWRRDSPRVLIGEGKINQEKFVYITHKISTLRRTKF